MKIHVIIDFMHIYYKYFFQLRAGKLKRLSAPIEWNGSVIEKDTSLIYYPLRDVEAIRKNLDQEHDVTISVCFDMKSKRTTDESGEATDYKAGRQKTLQEEDMQNLAFIEKALSEAGHNTYRIEGYEADDIVNHLSKEYMNDFDLTVIYTNDKDILVNVNDKVTVMRFKQGKGYGQVTKANYEQYLENEFGVYIPYNALGLFLSTVGDTADHIKGINKFGKVAFKKLITKVASSNSIDWTKCGDYSELAKVVEMCKAFLTDEQYNEMTASFALVSNITIPDGVAKPIKKSTEELRKQAYMKYQMVSLVP